MKEFFYIFLGGGLGSVLRYSFQLLISGRGVVHGFPWSTFTVNILGSLLIGLFYALSARLNMSQETRLFLTVGICGGFTTFSTFSNECLHLLRTGMYGTVAVYIIASLLLGILAVLAGAWIGKLPINL